MTSTDVVRIGKFLELNQGRIVSVTLKGEEKKQVVFAVPSGFIFDGASIPTILRPIVGNPKDENLLVPACIHDYLYAVGPELGGVLSYQAIADEIFYLLLKREKVSTLRATLFAMGVKTFGTLFKNGKKEAALAAAILSSKSKD